MVERTKRDISRIVALYDEVRNQCTYNVVNQYGEAADDIITQEIDTMILAVWDLISKKELGKT